MKRLAEIEMRLVGATDEPPWAYICRWEEQGPQEWAFWIEALYIDPPPRFWRLCVGPIGRDDRQRALSAVAERAAELGAVKIVIYKMRPPQDCSLRELIAAANTRIREWIRNDKKVKSALG